jgi:hypothetical protein
MNKLILLVLAIGAGTTGYAVWNQAARQSQANLQELAQQGESASNDLARAQDSLAALRSEVHSKEDQLSAASRHGNISLEMMAVLNDLKTPKQSKGWAELRQELGLGWDASPDYVLVEKRALQYVWFNRLMGDGKLSGDSVELLNLTSQEQAAIKAVLDQARSGQWLNVKNTTPSGDSTIAAQLTLTPPDPEFEAGVSNTFTAGITAAIGPERAELFLQSAWWEFSNGLSPRQAAVMTLRWVDKDGQPDLICEEASGGKITSTMPVRYATYPAFPVLKLYSYGWEEMARSMNFQLPPSFKTGD